MSRFAWGSWIAASAIAGSIAVVALTAPSPSATVQGAGQLGRERIEGVRTGVVTEDGQRVHLSAEKVESLPVRLLGPMRIGFLRSAEASDVRIRVDTRQRAAHSDRAEAPPLALGPEALGLRHRALVGLQVNGLDFRITDPIGRTLSVQARRCEMESATSLLCFAGALDFGGHVAPFARARFDGRTWQLLEAPLRSSSGGRSSLVKESQ